MTLEQCAICDAEIYATPDDFVGGVTGEPICPSCKETESRAEEVDL